MQKDKISVENQESYFYDEKKEPKLHRHKNAYALWLQSALQLAQSSDGNVLLYLVDSKRPVCTPPYLGIVPVLRDFPYGAQQLVVIWGIPPVP